MKLLFCASEAYPYAKSGGLADVAHALPKAVAAEGDMQVTLMLPYYRFMPVDREDMVCVVQTTIIFGGAGYAVRLYRHSEGDVEVLFVESPLLSERDFLYGPAGSAYGDNDLRFALFCHAICWYVKENVYDIVHLNDWHTALAALLLKEEKIETKVVFTIHNLAYQGIFDRKRLEVLGIDPRYFHQEVLEFYGQINLMKAGIACCDALTTVSPSYAREIQTEAFGCGLEGFIRKHASKLTGILNGIDTQLFNPKEDPMIAAVMKRKIETFKRRNKHALFKSVGDLPLFVFIGRLVEQKGIDLLVALGESLGQLPLVFAFLGEGDETSEAWLKLLEKQHDNLFYFAGYDEALAHQLYAAADFLVMPSRFEPCGLNQMIAMRYGAIPIVHAIGGLRDTVHASSQECGRGIPYAPNTEEVLLEKLMEALVLFADRAEMEAINRFNMACDFSFERSARKYRTLYEELVSKRLSCQ